MLTSMKFVAPLALSAMLVTSVASTDASAAVSYNPTLASQSSPVASVDKVWWRGGWGRGYGWRGGWRGYGWRGYGWRGYGWRGPGWGWRGYGWRRW